jgi:hypothetical protein
MILVDTPGLNRLQISLLTYGRTASQPTLSTLVGLRLLRYDVSIRKAGCGTRFSKMKFGGNRDGHRHAEDRSRRRR